MKILVTGAAGFIGSNASVALIKENHKILAIDNLDPYYSTKLKRHNIKKLKDANISFSIADIRDKNKLSKVFKLFNPEIVLHLAAKAGVRNSVNFPEEYFEVNVLGTLNLLQLANEHKVKKIMIASSSSVYGNNLKIPFSEEDIVENQISPYAASKKAMESLAKMYSQVYNLNIQLFRFFTVYGPSGRPDMAPFIFTKSIDSGIPIKIYGNLDTERDYTYIEDIVNGLIGALKIQEKFNIYNLGNNKPIKLKYFISVIENILSKKANIEIIPSQIGDVPRTWADIKKAKRLIKYHPKTSLQEGMGKFIKWYLVNKKLYQ